MFGRSVALTALATTALLAVPSIGWAAVPNGTTSQASVNPDGSMLGHGKNASHDPSLSADGRYVVFDTTDTTSSTASSYCLLRDNLTGELTRVDVSTSGTPGDSYCEDPEISSTGRYVEFESGSDNLVTGDTNGVADIFVRDLFTDTTTRVSVASNGAQANAEAYGAKLSPDGRYVVFSSYASNLVAGDTNGVEDDFLHDDQTGTTTRVSVGANGQQGNSYAFYSEVSDDAGYVAFESEATNLVTSPATNGVEEIYRKDVSTGALDLVTVSTSGAAGDGDSQVLAISGDGRYVLFTSDADNLVPGDTNGYQDLFVRDVQAGTTTRESVGYDGSQADGNTYGYTGAISDDGRYVAFASSATNLVAGDTNGSSDVFVRDTVTGTTELATIATDGTQADQDTYDATMTPDGQYVAFDTAADNLVANDTDGEPDVFIHHRIAAPTTDLPEAPYAVMLVIAGLGAGGVVAYRRRRKPVGSAAAE